MEPWQDDILQSMQGARRATPAPDLYDRIRLKITALDASKPMRVVRRPYLALAAASLALLISANVWAVRQQQSPAVYPTADLVDPTNFNLY